MDASRIRDILFVGKPSCASAIRAGDDTPERVGRGHNARGGLASHPKIAIACGISIDYHTQHIVACVYMHIREWGAGDNGVIGIRLTTVF
jgi:hypothetical protein